MSRSYTNYFFKAVVSFCRSHLGRPDELVKKWHNPFSAKLFPWKKARQFELLGWIIKKAQKKTIAK
jgi:hypothetical protein